ncbi:TPM domain-containing protein (plasmid) [Pedobacter sp. BS3]|uniref:TPM domain-containing protein n=1 Tax=Pedobacter sp. BS3 TaxID=2567937 RepID=UPI0011EED714|nr:TPM domain-containing protein [Pedobacter sp. BS3]TZF86461.1 TPM domain-containing protein [Pedobacter sp. BS3]
MALFSEQEQQQIRKAIEDAEALTSGEIRICIEKSCPGDALDRAAEYFHKLGMSQTSLHNGVLIYLATQDRKFAIIGDSGINSVVPENFWNDTKEQMLQYFKQGDMAEGIITGIRLAGEKLKAYFPYRDGDKNELSDDIAFF